MNQPDNAPAQPENPDIVDGFTILIRQALFTLEPFFMDGAQGDAAAARAAAKEILTAYKIRSPLELQLATECIVLAYAAMDTLRQSKAEPDMPATQRLRLRSNGVSLNRASHRNRRTLEILQKFQTLAHKPHETPPEPSESEAQLDPAAIMRDFHAKLAQHRARMGTTGDAVAPVTPPFMNH